MLGDLGQFLPHLDLKVEFSYLYCRGRIHLSDEGNEIFLRGLQLGLHAALGSPCGR